MTQPNIQDVSYPVSIGVVMLCGRRAWFAESRVDAYFLEKPDKYKNEFQTWNECGLPKMGDPNPVRVPPRCQSTTRFEDDEGRLAK